MEKKIALVAYFNTEPFLFGLRQKAPNFSLLRHMPADCLRMFNAGDVDIALVPVVGTFDNPLANRITDYGICCDNEVRTVVLLSNVPKEDIKKIYVDHHSRTSVQLLKVIVKRYWKINVEFEVLDISMMSSNSLPEAILMIGDKVFPNEHKYNHTYDLGVEWKNYTGLPFVFAVWIATEQVSKEEIQILNEAMKFGLECIPQIIEDWKGKTSIDLQSYFTDNIVYEINENGRKAIERFRREIRMLDE